MSQATRADKAALLRAHMSEQMAENLAVEALPVAALDELMSAVGLEVDRTALEQAKAAILAHASGIRDAAEKGGLTAAIALWNETWPDGVEDFICGLIEGERDADRRQELEVLCLSYEDAMRFELEPAPDDDVLNEERPDEPGDLAVVADSAPAHSAAEA